MTAVLASPLARGTSRPTRTNFIRQLLNLMGGGFVKAPMKTMSLASSPLGRCRFWHDPAPREGPAAGVDLVSCERLAPHDDVRDLLMRWIRATQPIEVVLHDPYLAQVVDAEPVAVLPNEDLYDWALRRGLSECTALGQLRPLLREARQAAPSLWGGSVAPASQLVPCFSLGQGTLPRSFASSAYRWTSSCSRPSTSAVSCFKGLIVCLKFGTNGASHSHGGVMLT